MSERCNILLKFFSRFQQTFADNETEVQAYGS